VIVSHLLLVTEFMTFSSARAGVASLRDAAGPYFWRVA